MFHKNLFSRNLPVSRLFILAVILCLVVWLYWRLSSSGLSYEWQWNRAWRQLGQWTSGRFKAGPLLDGIILTVRITLTSIPISIVIGLILALMRLSPWPFCEKISLAYVCIWRNTPLLLQLFFIYFLVAPVFALTPFSSALLALSAFEGAYMAEIFRAALLSVPRSQWEAAISLGFNLWQSLHLVILPQACRNAMPAFINQAVSLLKDTSLVSAIAVADLTMRAQAVVAETFLAFEVWLLVGAIYIILALSVSLPGIWLEKRHTWH